MKNNKNNITKKKFFEIECKIIDNRIFKKNWKINLSDKMQESIYNLSKITEIDSYRIFKNLLVSKKSINNLKNFIK